MLELLKLKASQFSKLLNLLAKLLSKPNTLPTSTYKAKKLICPLIFDLQYLEFSAESKNIRFALSTNGMNPFGENKTMHNTWPIILVMYNIPTWLCHKRKYLMLSIFIQSPKQAGIDIDVFLEPLMKDMAKLWNAGVCMWDQYQYEYFTLKAIIFVCIYGVPGGFTVSGQTNGKSGCPICMDGTASVYLPSSRKLVFMRH
jgi:hypothetical protein